MKVFGLPIGALERLLDGLVNESAGIYFDVNIDDSNDKANMNKEIQSKVLEEVAYREMPGAKLDVIGRIDKAEQDPLKAPAAQKPFIIQNSPAEKGATVKARMLEKVFNQDLETGANVGRVRTEKMRDNEDIPDFSTIAIPNYLAKYGQKMEDVEEIKVWTGIDPKEVLDKQRARGYGLAKWSWIFNTLLYGYSPHVMRANFASYSPSAHSNIFWGRSFGADYTSLEDNGLQGDLPNMDVAEALAYQIKKMALPPVVIGSTVYKGIYWCDYALWANWRITLREQWKDINMPDKNHPLHGYNIGTWAGVIFIDHGFDPIAPKKWGDLSYTTDGTGADQRIILDFASLDYEDISQEIGGANAFSLAFITGAGAVRINDGGPFLVKNDEYSDYEITEAGWVGQVMGMKRADRILNSDGSVNHNASFLHVLRRYKHASEA